MKTIVRTLILAALFATPAAAQDNTFSYRKVMAAGKSVDIRGVLGNITATPAPGNEVEVVARKSARRSDPASVTIETVEHADGVLICVIYEDPSECDPESDEGISSHENDTRVDFEVRLPRGVEFKAQTVAGHVEVTGSTADVTAGSVSGDVTISTTGIASASSVSGSLDIRMGRANWDNRLSFSTVSGNITVEMPSDLNAEVSLSTISGHMESDWPITYTKSSGRQLRGTIGKGGRRLSFSTVSGDVTLKRVN